MNSNDHIKTGVIGEDIAVKFLENKKYEITQRNYRKKWGEIDIVANKRNVVYFFEVKTLLKKFNSAPGMGFKPEDQVSPWKVKRQQKVVQSYLLEKDMTDTDWEFGIVAVELEEKTKRAYVKLILGLAL